MKIIAFVASRRGKKSSSYKVTKTLLDNLVAQNKLLEFEITTADELNLQMCRGCNSCFKVGKCILDQKDRFDEFKSKMENASLILLATPVYAHNISGDMKNFIDRVSYWLHLLNLAGKPAVSIVGSSCNGNDETVSYLNKIMTLLGLDVVKTISFTADYPRMLTDEHFMKRGLLEHSSEILKYLNGEKKVRVKEEQRKLFDSLRRQFKFIKNSKYSNESAEYQYWDKSGALECETYDEFIEKFKLSKLYENERI